MCIHTLFVILGNPVTNLKGKSRFKHDWIRNIRMAIRYEEKEYVLDRELKEIDEVTATPE